jgi:hypothetical protein
MGARGEIVRKAFMALEHWSRNGGDCPLTHFAQDQIAVGQLIVTWGARPSRFPLASRASTSK